jgi:predicted  nucleic acid-binding Zn-ribbon protein
MLQVDDDRFRKALLRRTEETLTTGYARALRLDQECLRIMRRITSLAAAGETAESSEELRALAARLGEAQTELANLSRELEELKRRVDPGGHLY